MPLVFGLDILIRNWVVLVVILAFLGHLFWVALFLGTTVFNQYDEELDDEEFERMTVIEAECIDYQFGYTSHRWDAWHFDRYYTKAFYKDMVEENNQNFFTHSYVKGRRNYDLDKEDLPKDLKHEYVFEIDHLEDLLYILDHFDFVVPEDENNIEYIETNLFIYLKTKLHVDAVREPYNYNRDRLLANFSSKERRSVTKAKSNIYSINNNILLDDSVDINGLQSFNKLLSKLELKELKDCKKKANI